MKPKLNQYWMCAYGHVYRVTSDRYDTPEAAAKYCFGVTAGVTCLGIGGKHWRNRAIVEKIEREKKLKEMHKAATGNGITAGQ